MVFFWFFALDGTINSFTRPFFTLPGFDRMIHSTLAYTAPEVI